MTRNVLQYIDSLPSPATGGMPPSDTFSYLHATVFFRQKCYPLHMLFFNLFYKVCKWQVYISLVIELLPYIRRHVMTMLLQMFPVVNLSTCFYTSMINQAMHDGLNVIR